MFIGPEGGFDEAEVNLPGRRISAGEPGKRILRTETAWLAMLGEALRWGGWN